MKILQVNDRYFIRAGIDVFFFKLCALLKQGGIDIATVSLEHADNLKGTVDREYFLKKHDMQKRFQDILCSENPDVVHFHSIHRLGRLFPFRCDIPLVVQLSDYYLLCPHSTCYTIFLKECRPNYPYSCIRNACVSRRLLFPEAAIQYIATRKFLRSRADKYIAISDYLARKCIDTKMCPPDKISVMYPFTFVQPHDAYRESTEYVHTVLFVGRLVREKGIQFLIKAMAYLRQCSNLQLKIVGEGYYAATVQRLLKKYNLIDRTVIINRWLSHAEILREIGHSSVVVVPSVWPEPFGYIGIDALAMGKPVVACSVGGIPEWLQNGDNGFLVSPKNSKGLAECIRKIITDEEMRKRYGNQGRDFVFNKFSPRIYLSQISSLYESLVH